jgi:hypothetical protein
MKFKLNHALGFVMTTAMFCSQSVIAMATDNETEDIKILHAKAERFLAETAKLQAENDSQKQALEAMEKSYSQTEALLAEKRKEFENPWMKAYCDQVEEAFSEKLVLLEKRVLKVELADAERALAEKRIKLDELKSELRSIIDSLKPTEDTEKHARDAENIREQAAKLAGFTGITELFGKMAHLKRTETDCWQQLQDPQLPINKVKPLFKLIHALRKQAISAMQQIAPAVADKIALLSTSTTRHLASQTEAASPAQTRKTRHRK